MFLRFEATMTGQKFSDIAPELYLIDIIEDPAEMDVTLTRMANKPGERVSAKTRKSLSVRLMYEIHTPDITRRAEIQRLVAKWANGYHGSGLLGVNYRPGKVLAVSCETLPVIDSSLLWTQRLSLTLTAHEVPYWEDEAATTKTVTPKVDANGNYVTLFEYMMLDGDFDGVPVDIVASVPWEGSALTKFTAVIGSTTFELDGLSVVCRLNCDLAELFLQRALVKGDIGWYIYRLCVAKAIFDVGKAAVVENLTLVYNNDPVAQLLNILHIVGGKNDGDVVFLVKLFNSSSYFVLNKDVETDGGLVEVNDLR